jgi:tetratricopeptide (TPR) repeat protein
MTKIAATLLLVGCTFGHCFAEDNPSAEKRTAPLLSGLGNHHHPVSTKVPLAQRYFDQGLILAYGFNHAEAERSFREAAKLDPQCAMAYWGAALVLGPNINAPMPDEAVEKAYAAVQKALELSQNATDRERAYIAALAKRYSEKPVEDRAALDLAYANAMRELAQSYPDDLEAATLLAESLMDTTPWDYWQTDGTPKPVTEEILATLESVLRRDANHPGANHFYIHAVEAKHPQRGIAAADRLRDLVPGAGHLVHMPSHIYIRVGRYHDASVANEKAIAADDDYVTQCHAQGLYPLAYMAHNHHFLWATTTFEGRSHDAIHAAQHIASHVDQQTMREPEFLTLQHYWVTPLYAWVRFGKWDQILAEPRPAADLRYPLGTWHYARGIALCRKGRLDEGQQELANLLPIAADAQLKDVTIWGMNNTQHLLQIAEQVLAGELAAANGEFPAAIDHLQKAVRLEDNLQYDEPSTWHHPVRQILGAVLLAAGQPAVAEAAYRQDLEKYPENGWSLFGLHQCLDRQGQTESAREIRKKFEHSWRHADVTLKASRF